MEISLPLMMPLMKMKFESATPTISSRVFDQGISIIISSSSSGRDRGGEVVILISFSSVERDGIDLTVSFKSGEELNIVESYDGTIVLLSWPQDILTMQ